ncbi:flagellar biosynthetic protein FliO [Denitratisoma sp. agr-D3]
MANASPLIPRLCASPLLLLPLLARAQQAETPAASSPELGTSLLQLGFGFIVVLALLFASLWLLKRLTAPKGQASHLMKVISTLAVGPRERVVLMEAGEQWLVLGVAPGRVTKLGEMPRQALPAVTAGTTVPDFSAWLKRALDKRSGGGA